MTDRRQVLSDGQLFSVLTVTALPRLLFLTALNGAAVVTELAVTASLSAAAYLLLRFCGKKVKRLVRTVVALLLPILFAGTVRELLRFADNAAFHEVPLTVLLLMVSAASVYAASLGIEAPARFSFIVALYAAAVLLTGTGFSLGKSEAEPLLWQWQPDGYRLLDCLSLPAAYFLLGEQAGKHSGAAMTAAVLVPYAAVGGCMLLSASLLGAAAGVYHYPLFVLFQLCKGKSFSGLDMLYISLALCSATAKSGVLLCLFHRECSEGLR